MSDTAKRIFEHWVWAGMNRDADAQAAMFTEDGVLETPLVAPGLAYPARMEGREAIREGLAAYHRRRTDAGRRVDIERSRYVLHTTADPDVFVVEIDTVFTDGEMSLVQIYRLRDGKIASLRDYFDPRYAE